MDVLPYTYITKLFLYILIHSYTSLYIRQNGCIRLIHPFCQTKKYILTCLGAPFNIQTFPFFLQISNFLSQSFSFCQIFWNTFQLKLFKNFPTKDNKILKPFPLKILTFLENFPFRDLESLIFFQNFPFQSFAFLQSLWNAFHYKLLQEIFKYSNLNISNVQILSF